MAVRNVEPLPTVADARAAFAPATASHLAEIRARLSSLRSDPPYVILLEGGTDAERTALALWYAALLNCPHTDGDGPCLGCPTCVQIGVRLNADLSVLDPRTASMIGGHPAEMTGKTTNISVENIRELRSTLSDVAHGDGCRITLLLEAQHLNPSCGNALLKIMEEPHAHVHFVMTSPHRGRLLPTLVSRGWTLTLPWPDPAANTPDTEQPMTALTEFLRTGRMWFTTTGGRGANSMTTDKAHRLLTSVRKALAAGIAGKAAQGTPAAVFARLSPAGQGYAADILDMAQESLDSNVNPGLVMDWMAAKLFASTKQLKDIG